MIATALEVTKTTAIVELRPCWLARMFGARTTVVQVHRVSILGWVTTAGMRALRRDLTSGAERYDRLILHALDFRLVGQLPRATALAPRPGVAMLERA